MPRRNLVIIIAASVLCVACYGRAQRNRFANLFADAVSRISSSYVEDVADRQLFENAMTGMLGRLDPYSSYIGIERYQEFKSDIDQEFGGIGIIVSPDPKTKRLMVLSPVLGTPAHEAGVLAGDVIVKVDGTEIENLTMSETVKRLRGKPGTDVLLTLLHRGDDETTDITITRAVIKVPSVLGKTMLPDGSWEYVLKEHPAIAYIRMTTFGERTINELKNALTTLDLKTLDGLILDLRSNAGGLLEVATDTCDMFLDGGEIVTLRGRGGFVRDRRVASRGTVVPAELPVAVLINRYSASASEIVAGCLQDHERAIIVGERSYGKGTVQNVIPLERGKSLMKLTTATFWRPSDVNIHRSKDASEDDQWGVTPNQGYSVPLSDEEFQQLELHRNRAPDPVRSSNSTDQEDTEKRNDASSENVVAPTEDVTNEESKDDRGEFDAQEKEEPDVIDEPVAVESQAESKEDTAASANVLPKLEGDPQLERAIDYILKSAGRPRT